MMHSYISFSVILGLLLPRSTTFVSALHQSSGPFRRSLVDKQKSCSEAGQSFFRILDSGSDSSYGQTLTSAAPTLRNVLTGLIGASLPTMGSKKAEAVTTQDPKFAAAGLGPLADLVGTWEGDQGLNVVAVPSRRSLPDDKGKFELIVRPYRETLSFTPLEEPVRNRGGNLDQYVGALTYQQTVFATDTNNDEIIHVENGMMFYLEDIRNYSDGSRTELPPYSIARSATIPHGNSALLLGTHSTNKGPPVIGNVSSLPIDVGSKAPKEFVTPYYKPINVVNPNEYLRQAIQDKNVIQTTHLAMNSRNRGAISNIPFVTNRADTTGFACDLWVERLQNPNKKPKLQLQYSQVIDIDFHRKIVGREGLDDGTLIRWPHITVNTLAKQGSS